MGPLWTKVVSVKKLVKYVKGDALCSMQVAEAGGNSVRVWVHVEGDSRWGIIQPVFAFFGRFTIKEFLF